MGNINNDLMATGPAKEILVHKNGLDLVIKPIPDCSQPGVLDPRIKEAQLAQPKDQYDSQQLISFCNGQAIISQEALEHLRSVMNAVKSVPIAHSVCTQEMTIYEISHEIPIRVYRPKEPSLELKPLVYYIHGGGFMAGNLEVVDELCKMIAQEAECIVVSVQYRLAPEHPFPAGLDDCYAVLKWLYTNAAQLGGDRSRLFIAGDSAGGNLATVCAMRDRDEQLHRIRAQILLYPAVNLACVEDPSFHLDFNQYEIAPAQFEMISGMITGLKETCSFLGPILGVQTTAHPYV